MLFGYIIWCGSALVSTDPDTAFYLKGESVFRKEARLMRIKADPDPDTAFLSAKLLPQIYWK
jgi:hypothetical protein